MAFKRKLNPKQDITVKSKRDFEVLKIAKEQEAQKHLKSVRIDDKTIILVDADSNEAQKRKSFTDKLNAFRCMYKFD